MVKPTVTERDMEKANQIDLDENETSLRKTLKFNI